MTLLHPFAPTLRDLVSPASPEPPSGRGVLLAEPIFAASHMCGALIAVSLGEASPPGLYRSGRASRGRHSGRRPGRGVTTASASNRQHLGPAEPLALRSCVPPMQKVGDTSVGDG